MSQAGSSPGVMGTPPLIAPPGLGAMPATIPPMPIPPMQAIPPAMPTNLAAIPPPMGFPSMIPPFSIPPPGFGAYKAPVFIFFLMILWCVQFFDPDRFVIGYGGSSRHRNCATR